MPDEPAPAVVITQPAADVAAALETLRAAGWTIREDSAYGVVDDCGIVWTSYAGISDGWEQARAYHATIAQQPWQQQE